jgi:glycosyltransferase involved in cell wall biosynthesis
VQGSNGAERVVEVNAGAGVPPRLSVALDATPLLGTPTGVGVFCLGALRALGAHADLDVRAFAVSWRRRAGIVPLLPATVAAAQRPMPARPLHALWGRGAWPPVEWFIGRIDVVHGTNFVVPPSRRAAEVVSVHDLTPLHHPELCNPATLAYPGLIRRAVHRGAWVHTDSAFVAAEVVEAFGADPARVRVVAPGVPPLPDIAPPVARALVEPFLPSGATRYVLSVGTAEPRKDLPGLVRAFDRLAERHGDLALVLAGPPGWGEEALRSAVDGARAAARVVRTGWLEPTVLAALLQQATVLAFPSLYEGFGFPPLEAMAAGVPVVATRAGSLPEVLGDGAVLIDVGDDDGLVEALDRVVSDPAQRERLVAAGTARAASFSWERCGEGLAGLYREAAGGPGG